LNPASQNKIASSFRRNAFQARHPIMPLLAELGCSGDIETRSMSALTGFSLWHPPSSDFGEASGVANYQIGQGNHGQRNKFPKRSCK
jgi:hypothetical protein